MREGERDRARQDGGRTSQNRQSRTRDREREASGSPSFRSGYSGPKNSHKAVREEIREEAVAAASRWIGERRFSSSWEA